MVVVNLRGVRESGTIFAAPTYLFIASVMLLIIVGVVRVALGGLSGHNVLSAAPATSPGTMPRLSLATM